jgi:manganese transport protein
VLCEIAICACDLAEVIGSAIALNLLFGIPLIWGVCMTVFDVFLMMHLQQKGFRYIEAVVFVLILTIAGCFVAQMIYAKPDIGLVMSGFMPSAEIVRNPEMLYLAIGILGATVMPHNLYLHSSIVQTRKYDQSLEGKTEAVKFATLDSVVALTSSLVINAGILIVAAAAFHYHGEKNVAEIQDAHKLLSPILGASAASTLFAVALLASGQNSTLTGTLAGQIVMEGFLDLRMRPWVRRLITRAIAIVPAVICIAIFGDSGATKLLIFSQVILSLQLGFAVVPLVVFTCDRRKMGVFVNSIWVGALAWIAAALIIGLNAKLVLDVFGITH